jgi:hypothetical protein
MSEEILKDSGRKYVLYQDPFPDQLRLEFCVPRGGFAEDYATMLLSQQERDSFEREGKSYIDDLVVKVINRAHQYEGRIKIL